MRINNGTGETIMSESLGEVNEFRMKMGRVTEAATSQWGVG